VNDRKPFEFTLEAQMFCFVLVFTEKVRGPDNFAHGTLLATLSNTIWKNEKMQAEIILCRILCHVAGFKNSLFRLCQIMLL